MTAATAYSARLRWEEKMLDMRGLRSRYVRESSHLRSPAGFLTIRSVTNTGFSTRQVFAGAGFLVILVLSLFSEALFQQPKEPVSGILAAFSNPETQWILYLLGVLY